MTGQQPRAHVQVGQVLRVEPARASAQEIGSRVRVSWLSCSVSPPNDQLVEPVMRYRPSITISLSWLIAPFSERPTAMLLPGSSFRSSFSNGFSACPAAWLESSVSVTMMRGLVT